MELAFNPWLAFGWSIFAGFLMAMGAGGGGILAGIGHISILGIGDPNVIKAVNQMLELTSRLFSVPLYLRQKRLIWSLAIAFGVGAPLGAISGSWASKTYLSDMGDYQMLFGLLVLLVAARTIFEALSPPAKRSPRLQRAFDISERVQSERARDPDAESARPRLRGLSPLRIRLRIGGDDVEFNPLAAAAGGFAISFVGATLGVGGGFLVTPFMASLLLFPMFFVVGTALVALMVPLAASVLTYIYLNVDIDWLLVAIEAPGIAIGSILGPTINRRINERFLRLFVASVLVCIGVYYLV